MEIKSIVEAILFVTTRPLSLDTLSRKLPEFRREDIFDAIKTLEDEYKRRGGPLEIVEVARGYQIRTRPEYSDYIKRFVRVKEPSLTKSMIETLAIVAYKQPITKKEIDKIRGVDSSRALKLLLERRLIRVAGKEKVLASMTFETTDLFLESFGLKSINELPDYSELEDKDIECLRG
jgi:segregation and condensation protein B